MIVNNERGATTSERWGGPAKDAGAVMVMETKTAEGM
jgi:hypothetical protein